VDLDPDCVIFGDIEYVPFDNITLGGLWLGPKALWVLGIVTLVNLGFVLLFYKELKLCTFDPALGEALGFKPTRIHYLLMTAVALTTVAAFESVGAILVVAFLIVPAAAAYFLTDRLWVMLILAVLFGVFSAVTGYFVAREEVLDCSVSGAMASMAGVWFGLIWLVAPRYGLLATLWQRRRLRRRFAGDLLLLHLKQTGSVQEVAALSHERFRWADHYGRKVLQDLEERGLVARQNGSVALTPQGETAVETLHRAYQP
jgi:manganese/zinc/iron transport system permease protein